MGAIFKGLGISLALIFLIIIVSILVDFLKLNFHPIAMGILSIICATYVVLTITRKK